MDDTSMAGLFTVSVTYGGRTIYEPYVPADEIAEVLLTLLPEPPFHYASIDITAEDD